MRQAAARADGYISREQKHRSGKTERSPSPILPEVLEALGQLAQSLPDLADDEPIFRGGKGSGRHQGKPLGDQGLRNIIRELFAEAGIREEVPDAISYDLRDSFAAHVGRSVRAGWEKPGMSPGDCWATETGATCSAVTGMMTRGTWSLLSIARCGW